MLVVVVIISLCKQVCIWLLYISVPVLESEAIALRARGLSGHEAWGSMTQSYYIINFDFKLIYVIYTWVNFVDTQMTDRIIVT